MADLTAQRTLVKSPPELWSELSEAESLAKHLGELGEIRITKIEPESTVAWEGEEVSGTVELEQSGWGTKVTFRATVPEPDAITVPEPVLVTEPESLPEPEPEPVLVPEPEPAAKTERPMVEAEEPVAEPEAVAIEPEPQGFLARWLFRRRQPAREPEPGPVAVEAEPIAPEPEPIAPHPEPIAADPVAREPEPAPTTEAVIEPAPEPVGATAADRIQQVLDSTLEALGQAHHRPFSRG